MQNQSRDGMTIRVNGDIYHETGKPVGGRYDWGDRIVPTGYFPVIHKYKQTGNSQIVVTRYSDQGATKQSTINHNVPTHSIGTIIGVDDGDPTSVEPYKAEKRNAFHGKALVVIQSTQLPGHIILKLEAEGLRETKILIESVE